MISFVGGILMIVGAYFVMRGKIFYSVITYAFADMCWVVIAIQNKDYYGVLTISIGLLLGLYAYIKMSSGAMEKELKHKGEMI